MIVGLLLLATALLVVMIALNRIIDILTEIKHVLEEKP